MRTQQRVANVVALVVISLCLLVPAALAQDCPELVGVLPGSIRLVTASGDYAYFQYFNSGFCWRFLIADVSNPSEPRVVGQTSMDQYIKEIAVQGGYAYVEGQDLPQGASLRVIDVSDPTAPAEVGRLDHPGGYGQAVAVSGPHAYVVAGDFLRVIDVSEPTNPVQVASVFLGSLTDVAVSGHYAYVFSNGVMGGYLGVIDVSVPSEPVVLCYWDTVYANGIAVENSYLYAAALSSGLHVVDVSEPTAPVWVGFVDLPDEAWDVAVSSGYAYVANSLAGLRVIDVSEPTAPAEVGFFDTDGFAQGVSVSEGYVFVADGNSGLKIFRECGVFSDGFESGDTSAWSAAVP